MKKKPPRMDEATLQVGVKNGCLTIIGDLEAYNKDECLETAHDFERQKQEFIDGTWHEHYNGNVDSTEYFDHWITSYKRQAEEKYYKCLCKCGQIRYVTPRDFAAKRHRFCDMVGFGSASLNSERLLRQPWTIREEYPQDMFKDECGLRKAEQEKHLAKIPRVPDGNYDKVLSFNVHETLEILGTGEDKLTLSKGGRYGRSDIYRLSKMYKCRCHLCGEEYLFTFDDFKIRNDTYGYRATEGYYSNALCDCHHISSFQWRTIKIFLENGIEYKAEVSFPDLYGTGGQTLLRYDFAVYENDHIKALIECQGEQHYKPVEAFGGTCAYETQVKNDALKREYSQKHHIPLIEIPYTLNTYKKEEAFLLKQLNDI